MFCFLVVCLTKVSIYTKQGRLIGNVMCGSDRGLIEVLSRHVHRGTEENNENYQLG
jgi:hypothetical protein